MRALVQHPCATGESMPYCTDEPGEMLTRSGWQPDWVLDVGQPRANFGRFTPLPVGWDGGLDPTARSYLLVGTRRG